MAATYIEEKNRKSRHRIKYMITAHANQARDFFKQAKQVGKPVKFNFNH